MNNIKFNKDEAQRLLAVKGVGPTVIKRLEEIGIGSLETLSQYEVVDITAMVAEMLRTTCWKNSHQAKSAIAGAIRLAKDS